MWKVEFYLLSNNLTLLSSMSPQQQAIITSLKSHTDELNSTFMQVVLFLENAPRNQSIRALPEFQTTWSHLSSKNHALIYDSAQLTEALHTQSNQLQLSNVVLVVILLGLVSMYVFVNYFILYRRTLKSVSKLQKGTAIIGSGNLNYSIEVGQNDEIGELSSSFNQMATNLRNVTASKSELEEEVARRKKAEQQLEEERKDLEKLVEERTNQLKVKERMAAIGQTAGMVGHDIRNPLQAIISDVYLLKEELATMPECKTQEGVTESIDSIEQNAGYISKIVADLQDYARPLKPEPVEVTDLCKVVGDYVYSVNIPSNIEVTLSCNRKKVPLKLELTFLKRILVNLVTNAVQAMPNGGKLMVDVYEKDLKLVISVQDTGAGIPDEIKAKIFQPMITSKSKGQGFGLAVVKRMVEALNGRIGFESEVDKGTKFIIELPIY